MHGEDLRILSRVEELRVGPRQLRPHQHRQHAADQKEGDRSHHKANADDAMVGGRQEAEAASRRGIERLKLVMKVERLVVRRVAHFIPNHSSR